jgi:hypothetical protein
MVGGLEDLAVVLEAEVTRKHYPLGRLAQLGLAPRRDLERFEVASEVGFAEAEEEVFAEVLMSEVDFAEAMGVAVEVGLDISRMAMALHHRMELHQVLEAQDERVTAAAAATAAVLVLVLVLVLVDLGMMIEMEGAHSRTDPEEAAAIVSLLAQVAVVDIETVIAIATGTGKVGMDEMTIGNDPTMATNTMIQGPRDDTKARKVVSTVSQPTPFFLPFLLQDQWVR